MSTIVVICKTIEYVVHHLYNGSNIFPLVLSMNEAYQGTGRISSSYIYLMVLAIELEEKIVLSLYRVLILVLKVNTNTLKKNLINFLCLEKV